MAELSPYLNKTIDTGAEMLGQIKTDGFARVELSQPEIDLRVRLFKTAREFFTAGPEYNSRYSNEKLTNGYRPPRSAYNNGDPVNEADVNDSYLYWGPTHALKISHDEEIAPFHDALEAYRSRPMCRIMNELVSAASRAYEYDIPLPFEEGSVLQVNSFGELSDRELLQTPHEDGVFATVIWTSSPGLEGLVRGNVIPLTPRDNEVFVMPGSVLSFMTAGEIPPFYHQARNYGRKSLGRKSIMYFSCPDIDRGPILPYVDNTDARIKVRNATDQFGLEKDFVAEH